MDILVSSTGGRAALLVALLALASLAWWLRDRRSGTVRSARASAPPSTDSALQSAVAGPGAALGSRATFLQVSSAVCAPCRRTATVLSALAAESAGVRHVELDVAEHPDLVRRLGVLRTPTVVVLDGSGHERGRSSGAMTLQQARLALELVPAESTEDDRDQLPTDETRRA